MNPRFRSSFADHEMYTQNPHTHNPPTKPSPNRPSSINPPRSIRHNPSHPCLKAQQVQHLCLNPSLAVRRRLYRPFNKQAHEEMPLRGSDSICSMHHPGLEIRFLRDSQDGQRENTGRSAETPRGGKMR
jgi:hypothetical protein